MHFPDSVLSPATSLITGAAMLPVWAVAARRVRQSLDTRQVPLLSLGAAFCFTIMLFNIPALGGTTAHPVAGTLLAVLLGPWAAVIGISVALAIQALFFGDGGLLAFGANCFAMAFALPFVGYSIYNLLAQKLPPNSPLRPLCAGLGAFVGLNAAAAIVAVLLGIQPALFHEANGNALFFPFGLKVTLPAMLGTHLLIAGPAEAIVTAFVVRFAQKMNLPLYGISRVSEKPTNDQRLTTNEEGEGEKAKGESPATKTNHQPPTTNHQYSPPRYEPLWIGLLACIALSPLGLLASGDAWGEWDADGTREQIQKTTGQDFVPKGLADADEKAHKGIRGLEDYASEQGAKGYILAGLFGTGSIVGLMLVSGRFLARRENDAPPSDENPGDSPRFPTSPKDENALPDWLLRPSDETAPPPSQEAGKPPNPFLERTLAELSANAATTLQTDRYARQDGYLQRLDPRAKLLAFVGLIFVVSLVRNLVTLLALIGLTLILAVVSRLPVGVFLRRAWLAVPLFVGAVTLPAALNVVTPGRALWVLWSEPYLVVTDVGLRLALALTLRAGVAVSLATLLTMTTPWNDLLRGLRAFFVPRLFISVLAMTYRYLAVLLQTASEMWTARRSRTVGRTTNEEGRKFAAFSVGALFGKTLVLAEEVHAAMRARGFQGEMRTLTPLRWCVADSVWTLAMTLAATLALGMRGG
jgi:cobalt/nickel transport system permease protein